MTQFLKGQSGRGSRVGSDTHTRANTRHLTRILIVLTELEKPVSYMKLKDYTGISGRLADALMWLTNHKIIKKTIKRGSTFYQII